MSSSESVCRTCILGDVSSNSRSLQNIQLKEIYEKFTSTKVSTEDRMPRKICAICYYRLQSFHKFSIAALKSEAILRDLYNSGIEAVTLNVITALNLGLKQGFSMTSAQSISIDDYTKTECNDNPPSLPAPSNRQVYYARMYDRTPPAVKIEVSIKKEADSDDEVLVKSEKNRENDVEMDNDLKTKHSSIKGEPSKPKVTHFSCNVCSKQFSTIHLLKSHLICHSGEKRHTCEKCKKTFARKHNMVQHMKICTPIEQSEIKYETNPDDRGLYFYCEVCGKRFTKMKLLKSHLISHSGEKPHACEGCKKSFSRKQSMKEHMKICSKVKPRIQMFLCSFCSQTFKSESDRSIHVTTHSEEKPYTCEKCHKSFSKKPNLKQHMKICLLENEMVNCTHCTQTFTSRNDLSKHLNMDHIEEKPYTCDGCSTKFWHNRDLKVHMRIHTGEKPFACETCGKTFALKNHLKVHIRIHTGEKPYVCDLCSKEFRTLFCFREHMRCHSGEKPYACNKCGKFFGHQGTLRQHLLKVHTEAKPFFCNRCSFSFSEKSSLTAHMKVHTAARPYACDVCDKTFTEARHLKGHMQVHSEERPHACDACGNAYKRRESLKQHMRSKCKASIAAPDLDSQI